MSGTTTGGGVTLHGHKHKPGSGTSTPGGSASGGTKGGSGGKAGTTNGGGSDGTASGGGTGAGDGTGAGGTGSSDTTPVCTALPENCQTFGVIPPGAPGNPAVTVNDLKNFPATPGSDHMEPNGWMVVGLSTNFYSIVGVELKKGRLLGNPATVRFTPISWHWTYGDGAVATHATPGTTWAAQGITAFDPTPTSHTYTSAGTYVINLDITFRADYEYNGGSWAPVVGTITLPANPLRATAGDAKTVLVNHDCVENPHGPGC